MGVTVRHEGEDPRLGVVGRHAAVGAALDPDLLVEIAVRQEAGGHHEGRGVAVAVGRGGQRPGYVGNLGRDDDAPVAGLPRGRRGGGAGSFPGEPVQEGRQMIRHDPQPLGVGGHVHHQPRFRKGPFL